jgi:uncharacterized protein YndB with AHSA1/START domain
LEEEQMDSSEQDFRMELEIAAPREAVHEALATAGGIEGWWDNRVEGEVAAGETFKVVFGKTGWTEFRVDRLEPETIEWACTGQEIADFTPTDEWVGTRLRFDLATAGDGTRLTFTHHGLAALDCIGICERGWGHHLGSSLKQGLEGTAALS